MRLIFAQGTCAVSPFALAYKGSNQPVGFCGSTEMLAKNFTLHGQYNVIQTHLLYLKKYPNLEKQYCLTWLLSWILSGNN